VRIVGYGNPERGDDAAGLLAAERLRAQWFEAVSVSGDALELLESWQGATEVIIVDAVVTGAPAGTIHVWDGAKPRAFHASNSTHGMGLLEALELGRTLHRLPARISIWGIEGRAFELGSEMTPAVKNAIREVTQRIASKALIPTRAPR
jgi:hydrogenase maturation protease